jgi:hypothetical protein
LVYDAKFDASLMGVLASTLIIQSVSEGYLQIDKQYIQSVDVQQSLFSKKCILTLTDGSRHTFDYGAMNIDKTVAAIQVR